MVIVPVPEEPLPSPVSSPSIRSLEALSLHCVQPFSTWDTQGRPFHARAQEALEVLLRHHSGGAGQECGGSTFCPRDPSEPRVLNPAYFLPAGWWLVVNEHQQMAWFPAPYLEEEAAGQEQEGGQPLGSSGMRLTLLPTPTTTSTSEQCAASLGHRKHLTQGREAMEGVGSGWQESPSLC